MNCELLFVAFTESKRSSQVEKENRHLRFLARLNLQKDLTVLEEHFM